MGSADIGHNGFFSVQAIEGFFKFIDAHAQIGIGRNFDQVGGTYTEPTGDCLIRVVASLGADPNDAIPKDSGFHGSWDTFFEADFCSVKV